MQQMPPDTRMDSESEGGTGATEKKRACDLCRTRKIKCDKVCKTTRQIKQPRQRVLISNQYEKKIDGIEDRLAGIEQALKSLSSRLGSSPYLSSKSSMSSPARPESINKVRVTDSPAAFEGNTTTHAHSLYAREVLERAVESSPMTGRNPDVTAALQSLHGIVSRLSVQASTHDSISALSFLPGTTDVSSLKHLQLPPQNSIHDLIQRTNKTESVTFTKFFPVLEKKRFVQLCEEVLSEHGDCCQSKLLIFHGALFWLFNEFSTIQTNHRHVESFGQYATLCRENLEIVLSSLTLLMPATLENTQALVLGCSFGIELSKPTLCWLLNSTAVSFCMSLGYHRRETMKNDTDEEKKVKHAVFWNVYQMDKSLSLRLGRASVFQDWDINIPRPTRPPEIAPPDGCKWLDVNYYWVQIAEIQGQVYQHLYSPGSSSKTNEERAQWAVMAATRLKECHRTRVKNIGPYSEDPLSEVSRLLAHSDDVVFHSVMALIHRAIPPPSSQASSTFSRDCVYWARKSLQSHLLVANTYKYNHSRMWVGYIQWNLLNIPFTPFMVVFCHVIAIYSNDDLELLAAFVESLKPLTDDRSEGIEKLYRLCFVFHQVARLYVEAKVQEARTQAQTQAQSQVNLTAGAAFDPYLSMLGFAPNQSQYLVPEWPQTTNIAADWPRGTELTANENMQDWFSGNSNIMSLLDQDIDYLSASMNMNNNDGSNYQQ
ncbi:fungal-specific transcription factor domain protein [Venturia nashicola]|nr:fungal-specific transcription factor domain protein [Venturia nashicola]